MHGGYNIIFVIKRFLILKRKYLSLFLTIIFLVGCCHKNNFSINNRLKSHNIVWSIRDKPNNLDPGLCSHMDGTDIINNTFEGLFRVAKEDKVDFGVVKSYTCTDDKKKYVFIFRDNVFWSDGKKVVPKDFEFAWKRNLRPDFACPRKDLFSPIKNAKDVINQIKDVDDLGVKALSDSVLQVELEYPVNNLFHLFAMTPFMPVRYDVVDDEGHWAKDSKKAISNGPFYLKLFNDYNLVLSKNLVYHSSEKSNVHNVIVKFIQDSNTSYIAYVSGNLDIADNLPLNEYKKLSYNKEFLSVPYYGIYFYSFNLQLDFLKSPKVRQAISKAIDRNLIVEKVRKTNEEPATGYLPLNFIEEKNLNFSYGFDFDVNKARQLLLEAGFCGNKKFPQIEIFYNSESNNKIVAEAVKEMLKNNLDIDVNLVGQEWSIFLSKRRNLRYNGLAKNSYIIDDFNPVTFLSIFLPEKGSNTGYNNKKYNLLVNDLLTKKCENICDDKMLEAIEILNKDMPILPLFYYCNGSLVKPNIKGYSINYVGYKYLGNVKINE